MTWSKNRFILNLGGCIMNHRLKMYDLRLVIQAIKTARTGWLAAIEARMAEIKKDNPFIPADELFNKAIMHKEVFEENKNLITLYSIIGSEAEAYIQALDQTVVNEFKPSVRTKKAA